MSVIDRSVEARDADPTSEDRRFMSGVEALVRLPLLQSRRDRREGLRTAGLISGYRGSPLGAYDQHLWRARAELEAHDVVFQPGLNEDLAATALWGAQMHTAFGRSRVDGVFGVWYGKGPGVDRSGDALRNANMLGTSALGGVVAVAGDDHAAQSSMFPHQTDLVFQAVGMPILQPASVLDILELGLAGFALSRFAGVWVGMKTIAEVVESAATVPDSGIATRYLSPADFRPPPHGLNWDPALTWPSRRAELERRLLEERLPAVPLWVRANGLDRIVQDAPRRRVAVVTVGKAHQDVMEALRALGVSQTAAADLGLVVYKIAVSWPLDTVPLQALARDVETILVVEEKRGLVEEQLKAAFYGGAPAPPILGKTDLRGRSLLPAAGELSPLLVAHALLAALGEPGRPLHGALASWIARSAPPDREGLPARRPFFCAGCPHNLSTRTPEGSMAGGGIGCHVMALSEARLKTTTFSQMGGEGLQWTGAAPFVDTPHIFQNLGDGTYQHSGSLAVRAAVAARANITFKILFNDAVAMTGGQPAEGELDPLRLTRQLAAEGVCRIALVSDAPARWRHQAGLAPGVEVSHRDQLDEVQRAFRETAGVTAIVYDQTCAAEKRRRRKRQKAPAAERRLLINPRVCEGCGDCQVQSNCIAIEPLDTAFGVKRRISSSACNQDLSCAEGFCPSFVEIAGGSPTRTRPNSIDPVAAAVQLPRPQIPNIVADYNIFVAGVGGSGVLTLGAVLGLAAHLDGLDAATLDFTGLAQKNGAVTSQVRLAGEPDRLHGPRISAGQADLLLGADPVVAAAPDALLALSPQRSRTVLNLDAPPTADALTDRDAALPLPQLRMAVAGRSLEVSELNATRLAEALLGDPVAANTLLLGFAWQKGWIPISEAAILRAIESRGVAAAKNRDAFCWGRLTAHDSDRVVLAAGMVDESPAPETTGALVSRLREDLTAYQDARYARQFAELIAAVRAAEARVGGDNLTRTAARHAYRLMAYKDEYEVARLHTTPDFQVQLAAARGAGGKASLWLAPPFIARIDPRTGRPKKQRFGPWLWPVLTLLAQGKALRGTWLDPFGRTEERRAERNLADLYRRDLLEISEGLTAANMAAALALAQWPIEIRGFGPVKAAAIATALVDRERKLKILRGQNQPKAPASPGAMQVDPVRQPGHEGG